MVIRRPTPHAFASDETALVAGDPFSEIHGIGPGIENRLHGAGLTTYQQLADLTPDQFAEILKDVVGMTAKRIADQDWIGQAKKLAKEKKANPARNPDDPRQHYELFSIELLLDELNQVRRTKVIHSQSKAEDTWAGWNAERVLNTIIQHADLMHMPAKDAKEPQQQAIAARSQAAENRPQTLDLSKPPVRGDLMLKDMEVLVEGLNRPARVVNHEQPYRVNLTLDLSKVSFPPETAVEYEAKVYALDPGGVSQFSVGTMRGVISQAEKVTIQIKGTPLPVGVYRLEAVVSLGNGFSRPLPGSRPMAMMEAGLLQIF